MTSATLLVELLTEELPPKALPRLGQAFSNGIVAGLRARGLATADGAFRWFATPRRLAVTISNVVSEAAASDVTEKIMPVSVALTADGQPTPALGKKLEAKGIPRLPWPASSAAWTARPRPCSTPPRWRVRSSPMCSAASSRTPSSSYPFRR
nr:glycine--tRNA ligase subunit beta [Zoogloea sp.]